MIAVPMRATAAALGLALALEAGVARAQTPSPTTSPAPSPTPFPARDEPTPVPAGVPPGYDDAIAIPPGVTPVPSPTPDPFADPEHDAFLRGEDDGRDEPWDPTKPFPGNYWGLPLTVDLGWWPCLDCPDDLYARPGVVSLWAGYALQPWPEVQSPFVAGGVEWHLAQIDPLGRWEGRSRIAPTVRAGWTFSSAAAIYATGGVVLPSEGRERPGWHAGVGVSSFAMLVLGACTAEAIPSVLEIGADVLPPQEGTGTGTGRAEATWAVKIGWGF